MQTGVGWVCRAEVEMPLGIRRRESESELTANAKTMVSDVPIPEENRFRIKSDRN